MDGELVTSARATIGGMNLRSVRPIALVVFSLLQLECNTDAAVFVAPTIESPAIDVGKVALGTNLKGSFKLKLHLSARASGPSEVTLGTFSLKSADEKTTYAEPLPFTVDKPSSFAVAEDSDTVLTVTIDTGASLLAVSVHDTICAGGKVVLSGVMQDSLQTTATTFASDPFDPTGC